MPLFPPNQGRIPPRQRPRFGAPNPNFRYQNQIRRRPRNSFPFNQVGQTQGTGINMRTIMGHVGTITNGINMIRQMGSIFRIF
ncbi:hypothetical protein [Ornithinibacillus bavariensis]|uniref:hypothetical protein n=1 Tax=Ornithinibacillus bavariensis TaxID=545502 RepID=UPI000EB99B05|nr:hypothetical protein [Ornithinibacillus sp.]